MAITATRSIGITLKFVVEGDDKLAQFLLDSLPGDFTVAGAELGGIKIGVRGDEVDPVRVAIRCEDVTFDSEDAFLENG